MLHSHPRDRAWLVGIFEQTGLANVGRTGESCQGGGATGRFAYRWHGM